MRSNICTSWKICWIAYNKENHLASQGGSFLFGKDRFVAGEGAAAGLLEKVQQIADYLQAHDSMDRETFEAMMKDHG